MRKDEILYYSNILTNKYLSPAKKIEIIKNRLFKYCKNKELTEEFKYAKTIEWYRELYNLLRMPPFDIDDVLYKSSNVIITLRDYDYKLINEVAEVLNERCNKFLEENKIWNKYDAVFKKYASFNHPSHNKKGTWKHREIDEAKAKQNEIKKEYPELFNRLLKTCNRFNTSIDLVIEVASKCFYFTPLAEKGMYQFNLKNNEVLAVFEEYYNKTNIEPYKNEYDKISLIRSILNDLTFFCFNKKFEMSRDGYYIMKKHTRVVINLESEKTYFQDSKSLNNHFISFNVLIYNLLRKPYIKHFHYILNDNNTKQVSIIRRTKFEHNTTYNTS